jgi:hypothetical protein
MFKELIIIPTNYTKSRECIIYTNLPSSYGCLVSQKKPYNLKLIQYTLGQS